jgi:hypothetical protein
MVRALAHATQPDRQPLRRRMQVYLRGPIPSGGLSKRFETQAACLPGDRAPGGTDD